jgi:hypothetical protein
MKRIRENIYIREKEGAATMQLRGRDDVTTKLRGNDQAISIPLRCAALLTSRNLA